MIGDSSDIRALFDKALVQKFKDQSEVLKFLLDHERKRVCINRLCAEIIRMNGRKLLVELTYFEQVIETTANMFAFQALKKAEQDALSSIEKIRMRHDADTIERAKEVIREVEKDGLREIF